MNGKQGPEESTGRFETRKELEVYVRGLYKSTDLTRKQMAEDCIVSVGTIQAVLKKLNPDLDPEFLKLKYKLLRSSSWANLNLEE